MDQFIAAYKDAIQKYAKFDGRLGVGGYWRFVAVNIVITIVLGILVQISAFFWILYAGYVIALLIPGLAAAVRRLHDTGKSCWLVLIGLIPLVGWIILIVLLVQSGQPTENEHGPVPA
jgi:uncharacterized membrane protein YhaH (DUF805 family)